MMSGNVTTIFRQINANCVGQIVDITDLHGSDLSQWCSVPRDDASEFLWDIKP